MLTRPEVSDPALEELKRRGRRRLVGAVVLMLAAAVILPLLLESDPKPLGEDVSIQIPPIDTGKFITPLSPAKGAAGKAAADRPVALPPSVPADAPVDAKASGTDAASVKVAEPAAAAPAVAPAPVPASTASGSITSIPEVPKPAPAAAKGGAADARTPAAAPAAAFVVQLAAFADAKSATALASKLKSAGFPAYTETLKTQQGTMRRVRVGPYPARDVADAQQVKLSAAGYRGVVTTK
jgi:DedD protein